MIKVKRHPDGSFEIESDTMTTQELLEVIEALNSAEIVINCVTMDDEDEFFGFSSYNEDDFK